MESHSPPGGEEHRPRFLALTQHARQRFLQSPAAIACSLVEPHYPEFPLAHPLSWQNLFLLLQGVKRQSPGSCEGVARIAWAVLRSRCTGLSRRRRQGPRGPHKSGTERNRVACVRKGGFHSNAKLSMCMLGSLRTRTGLATISSISERTVLSRALSALPTSGFTRRVICLPLSIEAILRASV